jgi:hypothetical protein
VSSWGVFFFFYFLFCFLQAREAAKSASVLFYDAMEGFDAMKLKESFERFERAAAKGNEESIWILSVLKGVEMEESALR